MKKKIVALGMALLVFAGSSMTSQAAGCPNPNSPDGAHYFNSCKPAVGSGRRDELGTHRYVSGYTADNTPIYSYDCQLVQPVQYCMYVCRYCGLQQSSGGAHEHKLPIEHSVKHK